MPKEEAQRRAGQEQGGNSSLVKEPIVIPPVETTVAVRPHDTPSDAEAASGGKPPRTTLNPNAEIGFGAHAGRKEKGPPWYRKVWGKGKELLGGAKEAGKKARETGGKLRKGAEAVWKGAKKVTREVVGKPLARTTLFSMNVIQALIPPLVIATLSAFFLGVDVVGGIIDGGMGAIDHVTEALFPLLNIDAVPVAVALVILLPLIAINSTLYFWLNGDWKNAKEDLRAYIDKKDNE